MLDLPPAGATRDHAGALELWTRGCEQGSPESCFEAGHAADHGTNGPANPAVAEPLLERACQAKGVDVEALLRVRNDTSEPADGQHETVRVARTEARERLIAIGKACYDLARLVNRRPDEASQARATTAYQGACHVLEGAMATMPCSEARTRAP